MYVTIMVVVTNLEIPRSEELHVLNRIARDKDRNSKTHGRVSFGGIEEDVQSR